MLFRKRSFPRWLILIPIVILILLGGGIAFARGRPTVIGVFPAPGAVAMPGLTPIRMTFSRAMNLPSVEQSLQIQPAHPGTFTWAGETMTFTPSEPWPAGAVISATLAGGARSSFGLPLTQEEGGAFTGTWSFSVARTMLAYLWPAGGSADLFMLDPIGGDVVQLTHIGGVLEFAVSADSLQVFFNAENGTGGSGLWRMEMLTRESALVLDCGADLCALPQPSPDGQWLAYENTSQNEIWLRSLTGADPVLLGGGTRPLWSAEGKLAFYEEEAQAFRIIDPAGAVPPASFPNTMGEPGAWTPDGDFFVAPDTDVTAHVSHLLKFLPINGLITNLSGDELVEDSSPAYSPDGQWLAFARKYLDANRWTLGRQVWVMDADGENARALTDDEFYAHTSFAWSPDSQTFAFVRAHRTAPEVPPEIWMVNVDGSARVQLVIGGYAPQWIP